MGRPIWREPTEKRTPNGALDPRRAAVSRHSTTTRPRARPSDRSSETLFNLLRSDYALESSSVGPARWNDISSATGARGGARRPFVRPESWRFRPQISRSLAVDLDSEVYAPWFPPASERERVMERMREEEEGGGRGGRELLQADEGEPRRTWPPSTAVAAIVAEGVVTRRPLDEAGSRFRFPTRHRYLADVDESEVGRQTVAESYSARDFHLPRFSIDGLGDRERSLSPDATQWELVANDLGFQAACDLWESEGSEGDTDHVLDSLELDRETQGDRLRRLTNLFVPQGRDMDRLVGRL